MKKLKYLFVTLMVLALTTLSSTEIQAGEKFGDVYQYELFHGNGAFFGTISVSTCDPCGWFRDVFACNCATSKGCSGGPCQ